MRNYKLIAFDMDGTLLDSQKSLPVANIEAIEKVFSVGKTVILSTGRCLSELVDFTCQIPNLRYLNCTSGACIYDLKENKTIFSKYIDVDTVLKILDLVEGKDVMLEFLTERHFFPKDKIEVMEKYGMGVYKEFYRRVAEKIDDLTGWYRRNPFPLGKLNIYHRTPQGREITYDIVKSANIEISSAYAEITSIEMSANGVDKGFGLEKLCEHLGIDIKDTVVVGDADNDIEIFKKAGFRIAMGNANSNIKALSDVIVPDCDNGGCVVAIEKYFL